MMLVILVVSATAGSIATVKAQTAFQVYDSIQLPTTSPDTFTSSTAHEYIRDVPNSPSYGYLAISGSTSDDPYERDLYVYISNSSTEPSSPTITEVVASSFSYSLNVLHYLQKSFADDYFWVEITTCASCGYSWSISSNLHVQYSASTEVSEYEGYFGTGYRFTDTGSTAQTFVAMPANGTVDGDGYSSNLYLAYTDYGDSASRTLEVSVDGQTITPAGGVTISGSGCSSGTYCSWESGDISSILAYQPTVTVSVTITTTSGYWVVQGELLQWARYEIWPDGAAQWTSTIHPIGTATASLYQTQTGSGATPINTYLGSFIMTVQTKEGLYPSDPVFYAAITTHGASSAVSDYPTNGLVIAQQEVLEAVNPAGQYTQGDSFTSLAGYHSPSSSGDTYNVGYYTLAEPTFNLQANYNW